MITDPNHLLELETDAAQGSPMPQLPETCVHGNSTTDRCDGCFHDATRWFWLNHQSDSYWGYRLGVLTKDGWRFYARDDLNIRQSRDLWVTLVGWDYRPNFKTWGAAASSTFRRLIELRGLEGQIGITPKFTDDVALRSWANNNTTAQAAEMAFSSLMAEVG